LGSSSFDHGPKIGIFQQFALSWGQTFNFSTRISMQISSPWKSDFPSLNNNDFCYLDSAATCQSPTPVIEAIRDYLINGQGNAGRGMHGLSEGATDAIESCRIRVAKFIGANSSQIIFTKGATESINYVASNLREQIGPRDSILITEMEHHSNLLPWQRLCRQTGARLNVVPLGSNGELDLTNLELLLNDQCALFAFSHGSNVLGCQPPTETLIKAAKAAKVKTLLDGAQYISHNPLNVNQLDCDYYAFSGHKLYASSGSGVLYCKDIESLEPFLLGGGVVNRASLTNYLLKDDLYRFEAGSANQVALIGLSAAIDYIQTIGLAAIMEHEKNLALQLKQTVESYHSFKVVSHVNSHNLVSFHSEKIHSHDIASILAEHNVAVRAGHHCAQPCLNAVGLKHCVRASVGLYNDSHDIERFSKGLAEIERNFS
jgi:cysteine desulfurase/selenocysteine lyase